MHANALENPPNVHPRPSHSAGKSPSAAAAHKISAPQVRRYKQAIIVRYPLPRTTLEFAKQTASSLDAERKKGAQHSLQSSEHLSGQLVTCKASICQQWSILQKVMCVRSRRIDSRGEFYWSDRILVDYAIGIFSLFRRGRGGLGWMGCLWWLRMDGMAWMTWDGRIGRRTLWIWSRIVPRPGKP